MTVTPLHTTRGRARLRVVGLSQNPDLGEHIERHLRRLPDVIEVSASIWSGNVVVHFEARLKIADLVASLSRILNGEPERQTQHHPWHSIDVSDVLRKFRSAITGLQERLAARKLHYYLANALPTLPTRSKLAIFAEQFQSLPVALLGTAAAISLLTGGVLDAAVIAAVVLINAAIGYTTETQAEHAIASLSEGDPTHAVVRRDGINRPVFITDIVPGDILVLEPSTLIAADARIIASDGLTVNEAPLTGESAPVTKTSMAVQLEAPLADRNNMVYRGTIVTGGSGTAVVVCTGRNTELGRIQSMVGDTKSPETPMQQQLSRLGRELVMISGAACGAVFVLGLLRGFGFVPMLKSAISLAVAAVPEGLPTLATTSLAIAIDKMRRKDVLIRDLSAIETLAAVQVVAFDKTGTLTLNSMSAVAATIGSSATAMPLAQIADTRKFRMMATVLALCNDAYANGNGASSTEAALLTAAMHAGLDLDALYDQNPRTQTVYRSEDRHYMATYHTGDAPLIAIKGNPEQVLQLCTDTFSATTADGLRKLAPHDRAAILAANDEMASRGLRVLAAARASTDLNDAVFLGLIGLADPVRSGMKELMHGFHAAGIHTIMVTGDQPATAQAIAEELGLANGGMVRVAEINGGDADHDAHVFARVSPERKLKIVERLQRSGKIVAMTGDGVNDSPALKAANVGITLGSGTITARGISNIVVASDDLGRIIDAVELGRGTYANIQNAIHYLLATNLSEILIMIAGTAAGTPHILSPVQLLWINLMTDVFPALGLALEPPAPDIMQRPPRPADEPIVRYDEFWSMGREAGVIGAAALTAHLVGVLRFGRNSAEAQSYGFGALIVSQLLHALHCRTAPTTRLTSPLSIALIGSLALQAVAQLAPPLRGLLGITPLGLSGTATVVACGTAPYVINKLWRNERHPEA